MHQPLHSLISGFSRAVCNNDERQGRATRLNTQLSALVSSFGRQTFRAITMDVWTDRQHY